MNDFLHRAVRILLPVCVTAAIIIVIFFVVFAIGSIPESGDGFIVEVANEHKNRVEYPLALVDKNDNSEYILIKEFYGEEYEVVTDTQMIKRNVSRFRVFNWGSLYGTTADGSFDLYKDGVWIDSAVFGDFAYTPLITYGTLRFEKMDKSQVDALLNRNS